MKQSPPLAKHDAESFTNIQQHIRTTKKILFPLVKALRLDARSTLLRNIPRNAVCAEIGVWKAEFSKLILNRTNPLQLHLIDPWKFMPDYPSRSYGGTGCSGQTQMDAIYELVRGQYANDYRVTIHRMTATDAVNKFADETLDWIYLDADHSEDAVFRDLNTYLSKVKKGGYLTGDDYHWRDEAGKLSVQSAVKRFVKSHSAKLVWKRGGQFLLQKQVVGTKN